MKNKKRFKPLWMIHNKTYRHYAKGLRKETLTRYWRKLISRVGFRRSRKQKNGGGTA